MIHIHFGLGNIGRGLILPTFTQFSNITKVYAVDSNEKLLESLKASNNRYNIVIANKFSKKIEQINHLKSFKFQELLNQISSNEKDYYLITFSIGKENLVKVKDQFIKLVNSLKYNKLIVICFENGYRVSTYFRSILPGSITNNLIFIDALIDRIVPNNNDKSLDVYTEDYKSIILDNKQVENLNLDLKAYWHDVNFTNDFEFEMNKKLWILNGVHLVIGWYQYNIDKFRVTKTLMQALFNPEVLSFANQYLDEVVNILSKKYNKDILSLVSYKNTVLERIQNPTLDDSLTRLARNTKLKLGKQDRILSPLLYAIDHNLNCDYLIQAFEYGLHMQFDLENKRFTKENLMKFLRNDISLESNYENYILSKIKLCDNT